MEKLNGATRGLFVELAKLLFAVAVFYAAFALTAPAWSKREMVVALLALLVPMTPILFGTPVHRASLSSPSWWPASWPEIPSPLLYAAALLAGGLLADALGISPIWGWIALPGAAFLFLRVTDAADVEDSIRGRKLLPFSVVERRYKKLLREGGDRVFWGAQWMPEAEAEGYFCIVGGIGSGKTLSIRRFMQSVLPKVSARPKWRALVYDLQGHMPGYLSGMGVPRESIRLLDPTYVDAEAWDIAADIRDDITAWNIAALFIPKEGNEPFYPNAARLLLRAAFIALDHIAPPTIQDGRRIGNWSLADAICACKDPVRFRALISRCPTVAGELEALADSKVQDNTFSELRVSLIPFEPVAALWRTCEKKMSLEDWATENSILVMGSPPRHVETVARLNQLVFDRITQIVLSQPDDSERRNWFILDELKEARELKSLARLLTTGRAKGVRAVLGFQTMEGLRDAYGDRAAHEIAGLCQNIALLRITDPGTQKWACDIVGEWRGALKEEALLPSEFGLLQTVDKKRLAVDGYYLTRLGIYRRRFEMRPNLMDAGDVNIARRETRDEQRLVCPTPLLEGEVKPSVRHDGGASLRPATNKPVGPRSSRKEN